MRRRRSWLFLLLLFFVLAAVGLRLSFPAIGAALIHDDGPAKADIAVVLAGDEWGNRIVKGAQLVRDGYVPAVLVSGPPFYDIHESDAAIDLAVKRGFPREWFIAAPSDALSTREEARVILDVLRRRAVRSFLLVTSDYHTARSARIYRVEEQKMGGGPEFRTVAAPDKYFRADSWWRSRQAIKIAFLEWTKTAATAVGM